jgi:hypothetical protein
MENEKLTVKRGVTLAYLLIFASLLAPSGLAQTCGGTSTLSGNYRFVANGIGCTTNSQQPHPCPLFPLASLGIITFDGSGNLSGSDVHNVTGLSCSRTFTGTYTVNPDCTGTLTQAYALPTCGPKSTLGNIVVAPDGSEILFILPDTAEVLTANFKKQ